MVWGSARDAALDGESNPVIAPLEKNARVGRGPGVGVPGGMLARLCARWPGERKSNGDCEVERRVSNKFVENL